MQGLKRASNSIQRINIPNQYFSYGNSNIEKIDYSDKEEESNKASKILKQNPYFSKGLTNSSYFNFSSENNSYNKKEYNEYKNYLLPLEKEIEYNNEINIKKNSNLNLKSIPKILLDSIIASLANYKFFIDFFSLEKKDLTEENIKNSYENFIKNLNESKLDTILNKSNLENKAKELFKEKNYYLNSFDRKALNNELILEQLNYLGIKKEFTQFSFFTYRPNLKFQDINDLIIINLYKELKIDTDPKIEYQIKEYLKYNIEYIEKSSESEEIISKNNIEKIYTIFLKNFLVRRDYKENLNLENFPLIKKYLEQDITNQETKESMKLKNKKENFTKIGAVTLALLIISGIIYNMLKDKDTSVSKEDLSLIIDAFDSSSFKDFKDRIRDIKIFKNLSDDYLQNIYEKTEKERNYGIFKNDSIDEIITEIPDLKILKNDKNGEAFLTIFASKVSDIREEKAYKERIKNTDPKIFNVEEKDLVKEEIKKEKELAFEKQNKEALEAARLNNLSDEYIKNTNSNIFTVEEKDSLSASAEPIKSRNNFLTASIFTGGLIAGAGILNNYRKSKDKNFFDYIKNKYNKFKKYLFTK